MFYKDGDLVMAPNMAVLADDTFRPIGSRVLKMAAVSSRSFLRNLTRIIKLSNIRNKSFNSYEWLKRRSKDPYLERVKKENYRCRSAFKLIEIDDKYQLVKPGHVVLDIGAAPGSWSEVLATRTNSNGQDPSSPKGMVIAVDINYIHPIEGVLTLSQMDFTSTSCQEKIREILGGMKLDFVFSDMAPAATGVKPLDQERIMNLIYPVVLFSVNHLQVGGGCLVKIWEGQHHKLAEDIKKFFKMFKFVRPGATYESSSESYMLGREFVGLKK